MCRRWEFVCCFVFYSVNRQDVSKYRAATCRYNLNSIELVCLLFLSYLSHCVVLYCFNVLWCICMCLSSVLLLVDTIKTQSWRRARRPIRSDAAMVPVSIPVSDATASLNASTRPMKPTAISVRFSLIRSLWARRRLCFDWLIYYNDCTGLWCDDSYCLLSSE